VDVSHLTADDPIYVSDLVVPKGVVILTDPETAVARFEYARADTGEEEYEMTADSVEIIEKGKSDEDDD
jgi:hypothetical protein